MVKTFPSLVVVKLYRCHELALQFNKKKKKNYNFLKKLTDWSIYCWFHVFQYLNSQLFSKSSKLIKTLPLCPGGYPRN